MRRRRLEVAVESWPLRRAFRTSETVTAEEAVVTVSITEGCHHGRGEASGVYYKGETASSVADEIEALRDVVEAGADRSELARLISPGGARNGLDCALWALEASIAGKPAWQLAGMKRPRPITTTVTVGADAPDKMAVVALEYPDAIAMKLKLMGDGDDGARVKAVRCARPDIWLAVDANQSLGHQGLEAILPTLVSERVALIEQPVRAGEDCLLDGYSGPIPLAADESIQGEEDLLFLKRYYQVLNIKLDKVGGLTPALKLAHKARSAGFDIMVGNMGGTSLAMAPAFLVGQLCEIVDLDGPQLLARDRDKTASYSAGQISCSPDIWA